MSDAQTVNGGRTQRRHWVIMALGCLVLTRCELATGGLVVSAAFVAIYCGLLLTIGRSRSRESELTCVFVPWDLTESAIAESILLGSSIAYHLENEYHARGTFAPVADRCTRFLVHTSRAEEAAELLSALRDRKPRRPTST